MEHKRLLASQFLVAFATPVKSLINKLNMEIYYTNIVCFTANLMPLFVLWRSPLFYPQQEICLFLNWSSI